MDKRKTLRQLQKKGIGSVWVRGFDAGKVAKEFGLPDYIKPVCLPPIGYPSADSAPYEEWHNTFRTGGKISDINSVNCLEDEENLLQFCQCRGILHKSRCVYGRGSGSMNVSYKKLWKLLIDKDMKKKDLQASSGVSWASITKMSKNENVSMNVLMKICKALNCNIGDIMDLIPDDGENVNS